MEGFFVSKAIGRGFEYPLAARKDKNSLADFVQVSSAEAKISRAALVDLD